MWRVEISPLPHKQTNVVRCPPHVTTGVAAHDGGGCAPRYTSAWLLATQTRPGWWRHPLQIPISGSQGEVTPRAWHDPDGYPATSALEAAWEEIAAEVAAVSLDTR